jgi:hypothetical protein
MAVLRDFAIILIAAELSFLILVPLVVFGALIYGVGWLRRHENLPSWLELAQAYVSLGQGYVEMAMALLVRPILVVHSAQAIIQRWLGVDVKTGGDNQ